MNIHLSFVIWAVITAGAACLGVILTRIAAWIRAKSETHALYSKGTVIAEYDAPDLLSPAELGYIIDATFGTNELLATIARLYSKSAVILKSLSDHDFSITAVNDDSERQVDDVEAALLGYMRTTLRSETTWSKLSSMLSDVAGPQADFEDSTLQGLVTDGLLYENVFRVVLLRKRAMAFAVATLCSLAVLVPMYVWGIRNVDSTSMSSGYTGIDRGVSLLLFIPVAVAVWLVWFTYANLLAYIYINRNGVPVSSTDKLRAVWPDVAGFRLFLKETEYVRLQHDSNPRDPSMAYCLALGLDPGFIRSLDS